MPQAALALLSRSIVKKQIVALTGIALVGFIFAHLGGNFLIFGGPEWLNGYAEHLRDYGPLLWVARIGLIGAAVLHIVFTVLVTLENMKARGGAYENPNTHGRTTWAKRTMILSGIILFSFVVLHLADFTFSDHHGDLSVIEGVNGGESLGLFGVVWNGFTKPWRVAVYVLAVCALGMHLSHGIQSFFQTLGLSDKELLTRVEWASLALGAALAVGYSAIPILVMIIHHTAGVEVLL